MMLYIFNVPLVEGKSATRHGPERVVYAAGRMGTIFYEKRARQDDFAAGSALIAFSFPLPDMFLDSGRVKETEKKAPELTFQPLSHLENPQKPVGEHPFPPVFLSVNKRLPVWASG
ncbi:MAG: hypothetical protein ACYCRD_07440 [Leptospirillum sp.]